MTYYPTLREDIERAKEILAKGKAPLLVQVARHRHDAVEHDPSGLGYTIYGADIYAAYKLLESFVKAVEVIGVDVVSLALRHDKTRKGREGAQA